MFDSIEFYSDAQIQEWLKRFLNECCDEDQALFLPGIPFSYYEVVHEAIRREYQKES